MSESLLRRFFAEGTPDPLAELVTGTHAVIDESLALTVYGALSDRAWNLTGTAVWPSHPRRSGVVWAVLAPVARGLVLVNTAAVDFSHLAEGVQWSLRGQHARHGMKAIPGGAGKPRVVIREDALTFSGSDRVLRIGAAYTASESAYLAQAGTSYSFLSRALQTVALVIAERGPISRAALVKAVYGRATDSERARLDMALTRLRKHPRVLLESGVDGFYTIAVGAEGERVRAGG
jgi:hypothetical protein